MVALWLLADRATAASTVRPAGEQPRSPSRCRRPAGASFLRLAGVVAVSSVAVTVVGRALAQGRAKVEAAREALVRRFGAVPPVAGVSVGVDGVAPWVTPVPDFYRIDTALAVPLVVPDDWQVRIHGMVDKEITLDYEQLLARGVTHDWLTLCCVSNPVGGDLISNAYWAGVPIAPILAEAGVQPGADAVLSRSVDGWTAGTPLAALTDGRNALFAVAMNGQPLTPEHGFPVRMVVPGLYGYVSATKWVVDLEVTRFSDFSAFWTQRGWSVDGAGEDAVADRRAAERVERLGRPGHGRGRRLGAAPRDPDGSRSRSTTVPGRSAGSRPTRRSTAGGSGRTSGRPRRGATPSRSAPPTRPGRPRPAGWPASCPNGATGYDQHPGRRR